jgi:hypothetical protein
MELTSDTHRWAGPTARWAGPTAISTALWRGGDRP